MKTTFVNKHSSLNEVFLDKGLSKLGDTFVNFIFSLAHSNKKGIATNIRVRNNILSEALKKTGYRKNLPSRIDRHSQSDAVEALLIYSWLEEVISLQECVVILQKKADEPIDAFKDLLITIINRLDLTL